MLVDKLNSSVRTHALPRRNAINNRGSSESLCIFVLFAIAAYRFSRTRASSRTDFSS